jgi:hypothetical protein
MKVNIADTWGTARYEASVETPDGQRVHTWAATPDAAIESLLKMVYEICDAVDGAWATGYHDGIQDGGADYGGAVKPTPGPSPTDARHHIHANLTPAERAAVQAMRAAEAQARADAVVAGYDRDPVIRDSQITDMPADTATEMPPAPACERMDIAAWAYRMS